MAIKQIYLPAPALRPYIAFYSLVAFPEDHPPELIPPNLTSGFCFGEGRENHLSIEGSRFILSEVTDSIVMPIFRQSYSLNYQGRFRMLSVHFRLGKFYEFFGWPQSLFSQQAVVRLEDTALGRELARLAGRLEEAAAFAQKAKLLDTFFLQHLPERPVFRPAMDFILEQVFRQGSRVELREILRQTGLSERHFRRLFLDYVGIPFRTFFRILRFYQAFRQLKAEGFSSLANVAYEAGYFDQAHFNRDFKHYTGFSPRQFVQMKAELVNELAWEENFQ